MGENTLKVMTLNINNYNDFSRRKQKIIALIKRYAPDIVALQEIRDNRSKNQAGMNQAKQLNDGLGFPHMVFLPTMDVNEANRITGMPDCYEGIALLSKFPFSHMAIPLVRQEQDKYTRKILVATIEVCGQRLAIFVVHFSTNDLFARLHAEETLVHAKNSRPIILGDFNIKYPGEIKKLAEQHGYISSGEYEYASYPADRCSYDYMLIPKMLSFARFECIDEEVSDHRALFAEIRL